MTSRVLTRITVEFPAEGDQLSPWRWNIFNADSGRQIITLTELHIYANADGLLWAEGMFIDGTREEFAVAGFKVRE